MADTQLAKVEQDGEVQEIGQRATAALKYAQELTITDEGSMGQAVAARAAILGLEKQAEARRKFFVDPYNALVKRLNEYFKPITAGLEAAKSEIGKKLVAYQQEIAKKEAEEKAKALAKMERERKAAEKAAAAGKITQEQADAKIAASTEKAVEAMQNVQAPQKTVRAEGGATLTFRTVLKVEVEDEAAVPRQYCTPDPKKYKDVALALHKAGQPAIPGIKVVESKEPTSRAGIGL